MPPSYAGRVFVQPEREGGPLRIAIYSNTPHARTGYGTQTKMLLPRLVADGHEVCILGQWGNQSQGWDAFVTPSGPVPIWPMGTVHYGLDVVNDQARVWFAEQPGWVLTLYDVWVLTDRTFADQRVASWTPVDHNPVTPGVLKWASSHRTIAMSRFGQQALAEAGVESVYIPHGIEKTMRPTPSGVRQEMALPEDAFLVMMNAANIKAPHVDRKAWQQNLRAFAIFRRDHPDAYLYLHTDPTKPNGFPIARFLRFVGVPDGLVSLPNTLDYRGGFITEETLANHYTAADVLLACSMGEGFGLPVAEAMACGTPAIVTDFSAQPEIVGDTGWKVDCEPYYDEDQDSDFAIPSVRSILDALEEAYAERGTDKAKERSAAAEAHIRTEFDADTVYAERWRPYLAELAADLPTPEPIEEPPPLNREQRRAQSRDRKNVRPAA